jgi:hypothetical protein
LLEVDQVDMIGLLVQQVLAVELVDLEKLNLLQLHTQLVV